MYIYRHGKIVSLPYNPKNVHNVLYMILVDLQEGGLKGMELAVPLSRKVSQQRSRLAWMNREYS